MAVKGYNFQVNGVKVNDGLQASPTYTFDGLFSDTAYDLTYTAVDFAGNESAPSIIRTGRTLAVPPPPTDGPLSLADRNAIDAIVTEELKSPGIALAITGPRGYYSKAYGIGTRTSTPMNIDNHFRLGSVSKTFTAHAVFQQIDLGTLALTDTLNQFVEGVPNGGQITVQHMMMMRSGIFDYTKKIGMTLVLTPTSKFTAPDALAIIRENPAQFTPGTAYQYTNGNTVLLGMVLEAITGRPIRDIINQDVIAPLGLTQTSFPAVAVGKLPADVTVPPPFADGYMVNPILGLLGSTTLKKFTQMNPDLISGAAGAIITTASDLVKWIGHMRDGTRLSAASRDMWHTTFNPVPYADEGPPEFGYGLGMVSFGRWLGHDGSIPGYDSNAMWHRDNGAAIAVLENQQTPKLVALSRMHYRIGEYLYPGSMVSPGYTPKGTITARAQAARAQLAGRLPVRGVLQASARPAVARLFGATFTPGQAAGSLAARAQPARAALTGKVVIRGPLAARSTPAKASFSGTILAPVQIVGYGAVDSNNVTLPTLQVGDLIVMHTVRDGSTFPPGPPTAGGTVPTWLDVPNCAPAQGSSALSTRTVYAVATATNHTSGTFSTCQAITYVILRGQKPSPFGGTLEAGGTSSLQSTAPTVTLTNTNGSSQLLHFLTVRATAAWGTIPAGYTSRAANTRTLLLTKDDTISDGSVSVPVTGNTGTQYRGATVEVVAL